jgi:hypothetical protein
MNNHLSDMDINSSSIHTPFSLAAQQAAQAVGDDWGHSKRNSVQQLNNLNFARVLLLGIGYRCGDKVPSTIYTIFSKLFWDNLGRQWSKGKLVRRLHNDAQ